METSNWVEGEWTRDMATLLYSSTFLDISKTAGRKEMTTVNSKWRTFWIKKKAVAPKFSHTIIIGIWRQNNKHNKKKVCYLP